MTRWPHTLLKKTVLSPSGNAHLTSGAGKIPIDDLIEEKF